ncbi:MAG: hypothetical protein HKN56_07545 [Gammaproteobacteria bacterium]|nr:hypothetical protein [Gammaproteobacteria bacterium]NND54808.1 hypothetical protein [Gammaproteobacteria bacterium]
MKKRINRYTADTSTFLPNSVFLAVLACVGWWLYKAGETPLVTFLPFSDYWQYVAAVRELIANFTAPGNPVIASDDVSVAYNPYLAVLALIAKAFGLDAMQAMAVGAALNLLLIAAGVRLFMQAYFRHAWAPALGLIVVFFGWGIGWNQHNVYQLGSFLHTASYPSAFVFGVSLIAFRLTVQMLSNDSLTTLWAALLAVAAAVMFLCDPPTSTFGIVGCLLLILTEPTGDRLNRLFAAAMLLAGLGVAEVWPYFSPWSAALGLYPGSSGFVLAEWLMPAQRLMSGVWNTALYSPSLVAATLGIALVGVPIVILLGAQRRQRFIVIGAVLMLLPYVLNLLFPIPQAERFIVFVAFYLQLAMVWGWLRMIDAWNEIPRSTMAAPALLASVVAGAGMVTMNVWMAELEFAGKRITPRPLGVADVRTLPDGLSVDQLYDELFADVPEDAVVLSSADDGHALAALSHKGVSARFVDPTVADWRDRYLDTHAFFFMPVSELQRVAVVQKYDASHVLLNTAIPSVANFAAPWAANYGQLVASRGDYRVYALSPALHDVVLPEPEPEVVASEKDEPSPAAEPVPAPVQARAQRPSRAATDIDSGNAVAEEETAAEEAEQPARSFGAPISAPVLDPRRHGG